MEPSVPKGLPVQRAVEWEVQWAFAVCSGALCIGLDTFHLLSVNCSKQLVQGKRQHVCPGVATGHCLQDLPLLECAGRLPLCKAADN